RSVGNREAGSLPRVGRFCVRRRGRLPDRRRGHGHFGRGRLSLVAESRGRSCSRSGKGRLAPPIPVTPKTVGRDVSAVCGRAAELESSVPRLTEVRTWQESRSLEVRASRTWTGLAGSGCMALIDNRDVAEAALRVLTDPARWGAHHDLTGPVPMSWPEALELLSAELGEPVTFQIAAERQLLQRLTGAGVPAGTAELLITREWATLAGENDYTTGTFQQIPGRPPRPVAEFLHEYRAQFA